jgi:cytochrome b
MDKKLVYDLPTRIFHWLFAVLFLGAFVIAKTVDDESPVYALHMLAGIAIVGLVIFRIVWGFIGTQHARFSNFALRPADMIVYFKDIVEGGKKRWAGHNPASSWAAISMLALAIGLGVSGYLMVSGVQKETFEEVHELFANLFIVIVVLHLAGIVLHTVRHKEMIALSMVDGKKSNILSGQVIPSPRPVAGIMFAGLACVLGLYLFTHYDRQVGQLDLFGAKLQLVDQEDGASGAEHDDGDDDDLDNDDDED